MNSELHVSLMRGRRILDVRSIPMGCAFSVSPAEPLAFERLSRGVELDGPHVVIDFREEDPVIDLPDGALGELAAGSERSALRSGSQPIASDARGWITLGGTTLFLQRRSARAPVPVPGLPAGIRRRSALTERRLVRVLVAVLAAELVLVALVHRRPDIPVDEDPNWANTFLPLDVPARVVPLAPKAPQHLAPKPGPPGRADRPPVSPARSPSGSPTPSRVPGGILLALGALRNNPLFQRTPDAALIQALEGVSIHPVASLDLGGHRTAGGSDAPVELGGLPSAGDGPHAISLGERRPVTPPVVEFPRDPLDPPAPEDGDEVHRVAAQIRARKQLFQSCYEAGLRLNPRLAGKMIIQFDVARGGQVEVSFPADRLDEGVVQCIETNAGRWKFTPLLQHDTLSMSFPFIFASVH